MRMPSESALQALRERYKTGTRLRLTSPMNDPQPIPVGSIGTCLGCDDAGSILMRWDCGRSLSLIPGEDDFEVVNGND